MVPPRPIEPRFKGPAFNVLMGTVVLWSLLVFVRYFTQRPLDPSSLFRIFSAPNAGPLKGGVFGESIIVLLVAALVVLFLVSLGDLLSRAMGSTSGRTATSLPGRFAWGILLVNAFWLGTGFCGLWRGPILIGAGGAFLLWGGTVLLRQDFNRFPVKTAEFRAFWTGLSWPLRLLVILTGFYFTLSLCHGLVPETFYDSQVYHLAVPAYWIASHGIVDHPLNFFSNYPYGGELFMFNGFLWGPVFGSQVAKVLNVTAFLMAAWAARDWTLDMTGDRESGILAGALLFTTPLLVMNVWSTQLEGLLCLFVLLFMRTFFEAVETGESRGMMAAGLFAGLAASVKYTSVLGMGAGVLALLILSRRASTLRAALLAGTAALVVVAPWILKNAVFTGNPFQPYLSDLLGGSRLPAEGLTRLLSEQREMHALTWREWLILPWSLVMREPVGPMFLAGLPLLFMVRFRSGSARPLGLAIVIFFVAALALTHHMRFLLVGFAAGYVGIACAIAATPLGVRRTIEWMTLLAALLVSLSLAGISARYYSIGGVLGGVETRSDYLKRAGVSPYYGLPEWVNANLPPEAVLLVAGDARGLYYERKTLTNSVFDDQVLTRALREGLGAAGILERLRRLGVTHLVVNGEEGLRSAADYRHYELTSSEWERLEDFSTRCLRTVAVFPQQIVYQVLREPREGVVRPIPGLFHLMSRRGTDFVRALSRGDREGAVRLASEGIASCPGLSFWWEQKAQLESYAGKEKEALELFEKADARGVLRPEGYARWTALLEKRGARVKAETVRGIAKIWYPDSLERSNGR